MRIVSMTVDPKSGLRHAFCIACCFVSILLAGEPALITITACLQLKSQGMLGGTKSRHRDHVLRLAILPLQSCCMLLSFHGCTLQVLLG